MTPRLSPERIKELQKLLKDRTGKDYTEEEAQEAGLAIMRFVYAKETRKKEEVVEPKKKSAFPQTINGIYFASKKEYDQRVESDMQQLAAFLLKMYRQQKSTNKNI